MDRKYYVIFKNDYTGTFSIIAANLSTLEEAKKSRWASGDLVVDENFNVVPSKSWLWDWELQDLNSYAHLLVQKAIDTKQTEKSC